MKIAGHSSHKATVSGYFCVANGTLLLLKIMRHWQDGGTQSLAVTIRVLVDENLTLSKKLQLLWKETRVGLLNGAILAVMALGFLGCYIHFFKGYVWTSAFLLSGCVGLSLIVSMVISSLVGTLLPMLFHKIHIDPAVASGPLITTINDLVAVVVYYGLAMVVLIDLFHLA